MPLCGDAAQHLQFVDTFGAVGVVVVVGAGTAVVGAGVTIAGGVTVAGVGGACVTVVGVVGDGVCVTIG